MGESRHGGEHVAKGRSQTPTLLGHFPGAILFFRKETDQELGFTSL